MFNKIYKGMPGLIGVLLSLSVIGSVQAIAAEPIAQRHFLQTGKLSGVWVAQDRGDFPETEDIQEAEQRYNAGTKLQEDGNLEGAIAEYREAVRLNPNFAEAQVNLGVALANLGQTQAAIAAYEEAIRINPDLGAAHYNMGNALAQQQQLEAAISAYDRAIRIQPNYGKAYYNMGNALVNLSQIDRAIRAYREAIRINPEFAEAHGNLGIVLYQQGKLEEAAPMLRTARDLFQTKGNAAAANRVEQLLRQIDNNRN